jgi:hypothetical protein
MGVSGGWTEVSGGWTEVSGGWMEVSGGWMRVDSGTKSKSIVLLAVEHCELECLFVAPNASVWTPYDSAS